MKNCSHRWDIVSGYQYTGRDKKDLKMIRGGGDCIIMEMRAPMDSLLSSVPSPVNHVSQTPVGIWQLADD